MSRMPIALAAGVLSSVASFSGVAAAQGTDEFGSYGRAQRDTPQESPQNVAVEIRFGRYVPNVDDEFDGAGPFDQHFGDDNRYLLGFEVDWQALRIPGVGTVGPGFGWGYTKASGANFVQETGEAAAGSESSLAVMPMYLVGVLRVDVLSRTTPVPLAAYGKAGLGYALWWTNDGTGTARDDDGVPGRDVSYGYQFALGAMLLLDSLDPDAAVEMDTNTGVNNSYFFFEWYFSNLDGFGGDKMQVGDNTWMLGLALEI